MDQQALQKAILETKDRRSRLKARLTSSTKQLKTATASNSNLPKMYADASKVYSELLDVHYHYVELVNSDEKFLSHATVGGLDLDAYLDAIESNYTDAMKYFASVICESVTRALKRADFFTTHLSPDVFNADTLYIVQQAESHLSQCRELSELSSNIQYFDSGLGEQLDSGIFKLGQCIHICKHTHGTKAVHFDRSVPNTGRVIDREESDSVALDTVTSGNDLPSGGASGSPELLVVGSPSSKSARGGGTRPAVSNPQFEIGRAHV